MRTNPPDIVTLDVMMPKLDGWSVLGIMKSEPQLAHIPVIMLTIVDHRNLGFSLGASEYMTKPIDRNRLIALIQKFAATKQDGVVLVIDDDPDVRAMVKTTIESVGMQAAEAANGQAALDWLGGNPQPALVLLDLMMPKMDGFEFLDHVRQNPEFVDLPIVVLTAKELTDNERSFLAERTLLVLSKSAQPISKLGYALAAIAGRNRNMQRRGHGGRGDSMTKILLVEDNEMNRDMLSRRLTRNGFEIVIAVNGQKVSISLRSENPDLILHGYEPAGARRLGGDAPAEGQRRHRKNSGYRADRPCDGAGQGKGARRRLRRLRYQAGRTAAASGKDQFAAAKRRVIFRVPGGDACRKHDTDQRLVQTSVRPNTSSRSITTR